MAITAPSLYSLAAWVEGGLGMVVGMIADL